MLVRKSVTGMPSQEIRVAVIGNVDSGKSTLVGVLTRGMLDDGRGLARSKVRIYTEPVTAAVWHQLLFGVSSRPWCLDTISGLSCLESS